MHIALGVSRRWYHMSRNSSENVLETSVCIHYVPLFSFTDVHATVFTVNGLQKYAKEN